MDNACYSEEIPVQIINTPHLRCLTINYAAKVFNHSSLIDSAKSIMHIEPHHFPETNLPLLPRSCSISQVLHDKFQVAYYRMSD